MPEQTPQPPKPEPKKGIFSSKEEPSPNIISDISAQLNNASRSLKSLEDKYTTLRNKSQVTEHNMIANDRKIMADIKLVNSEIMDLKVELNDMREKLILLVKELKLGATKEEIKLLQKYISYWEPLNFVTRQEFEKVLSEQKIPARK